MPDKVELMRTGIGLLTLVSKPIQQGKVLNALDEDSIKAAVLMLRQNVTNFSMDFVDVPQESLAIASRVAKAVAAEYEQRTDWLAIGLLKGFIDLLTAYLQERPDADIAALLQRASLDIEQLAVDGQDPKEQA